MALARALYGIKTCLALRRSARLVTQLLNCQPRKSGLHWNRHAVSYLSTHANQANEEQATHTIKRKVERPIGAPDKREFKAETRMLLNIVAKSLYSENEVFVRELISNASDALEKFRYAVHTAGEREKDYQETDRPLEIRISTDKQGMQLIIQDTGIGMTRQELVNNLGTIARSGSKKFLDHVMAKGIATESSSNIIGNFGVGFYSAFMVADRVEVYSRSSIVSTAGYRWISDGSGSYEIQKAEGVEFGTKIIVYLKKECREYADEDRVKSIIKKYSNFVGSPIYLNGKQANVIQPVWLMEPKEVTTDQHTNFYRFITNTLEEPRFVLHYKTDVPLSIRALLYFPEGKPDLFNIKRNDELVGGVALYTRKVLIQSKTANLLPTWLRFLKGVVDSEDIPLNLSRELLQNSVLIRKLSDVLTARVVRFLQERQQKQPEEYEAFFKDYGVFIKEGIITSTQTQKQDLAKLLLFESSKLDKGRLISLEDYCKNVGDEQKDIYFVGAPSRVLAESSPYFESLKKRDVEVLFCFEPYDEIVLINLATFNGKSLMSVEKEMSRSKADEDEPDFGEDSLERSEVDELRSWLRVKHPSLAEVKVTTKLDTHPCVITVEEMAAARHFIRTQGQELSEEARLILLQPQLQINPKHPIIKKLYKLRTSNPELADLLSQQLFANAMVSAGLAENSRLLLLNMNDLLTKALENN